MDKDRRNLEKFLRPGTPEDVIELYLSLKSIAEDSSFDVLDNDLVIVDTEATGLSFSKDELIQIAAARISDGNIVDWFTTFVDPGIEIPDEIVDLTHISNDDVFGAPSPNEALKDLAKFVGKSKMLAHNVSFDKTFLTKYLEGYPFLDNIWIDSLDLVRICFPRLTSHRLIDLSRAFNIVESTHRADDDVYTTAIIYRLCLALISCMDLDLIKIIADYSSIDMWNSVIVFREMYKLLCNEDCEDFESVVDSFDLQLNFGNTSIGRSNPNIVSVLKNLRRNRISVIKNHPKHDLSISDDFVFSSIDSNSISPLSLQFSDEKDIDNDFSTNGLLGQIYPDFEVREEQKIMSKNILKAFKNSQNLVVEAGTGVGKSMSYLIPAIKLAMENDIIVGVATKTNALLDQLVYSELPSIKKVIPNLEYSSLKGAQHYICLRKLSKLANQNAKIVNFQSEQFCTAASVASLLSFVDQTQYDDCDGIKINSRALSKNQYISSSHECYRHKCPFYRNGCFVHGARRTAENSDIVVTNHTFLFCNLKADGGLMPQIRYWIIDEAHNIENEARSAFQKIIPASKLLDYHKTLSTDSNINIFKRILSYINVDSLEIKSSSSLDNKSAREGRSIIYGLLNKAVDRGKDLSESSCLFANNLNLLLDHVQKSKNGYEFCDIWIDDSVRAGKAFNEIYSYAKKFSIDAESLLTCASNLVSYLDDYKDCAVAQTEISAFIFELKDILDACDTIFFRPQEKYVYSAHLNIRRTVYFDNISAALINVSDILREKLFSQCLSCIMTSATLSISNSVSQFIDCVGVPKEKTKSLLLKSSFDYDKNMTIYVTNDIPEPNDRNYLDTLIDFLIKLHIAAGGSILTLFTNRREMNLSYKDVAPAVESRGYKLVCQKWKTSPKLLRDQFLNDENMSLFALKSFWEGFDVPGDALKGVVIPKLPFSLPTDPLYKERSSREKSAWFKYTIPESIIAVKQAVGRLIRKSSDSGYIVFADSRLITKKRIYGDLFLNSLPSNNIKVLSSDSIIDDINNKFFYG